jgi:2-haloacid dehalogenase
MEARPKALLFDLFGTVVDWRTSLIDDLSAWGRTRAPNVDWVRLVDDWRAGYQPAMEPVRAGLRPFTDLETLNREILVTLLARAGAPPLSEAEVDHVNDGWRRLRGWPDSSPGLHRLAKRFTLAPLSNGTVAQLLGIARVADLPWHMLFATELFQTYKPRPETYLGACRLLRLAPAEVMMVAAHNGDLRAARAQGLATAFIARPTEYGPRQKEDFRAEDDWDLVVASLTELAERLCN